jgi:selT/selW/selH-like putative selenoprotein
LAAELETLLAEPSQLIQSSGGVFEVEHDGKLLFSKKALHRFPQDGEVAQIVKSISEGMPLEQAQQQAAENAPLTPSFYDWVKMIWNKRRTGT